MWISGMSPPWPCSVSEFLLGEVDSSTLLAVPPGDPGQVSSQVKEFVGGSGHLPQGGHLAQLCDYLLGWAVWASLRSCQEC